MTRSDPRSTPMGTTGTTGTTRTSRTASTKAHQPAERNRVVAWVVCGMLLLHVLGVACVLVLARWAGADTEARVATLPWAFPKVEVVAAQPTARPVVIAPQPPDQSDWLSQAQRKDANAPWTYDRAGNVVWR